MIGIAGGATAGLILALMFALMALGIPIFISIGLAALAGLSLFFGPHQALIDFSSFLWQGLNIFELVAIPLFVFVGMLIKVGLFADDLFEFARVWLGSLSNGLGVGVVLACAIFAGICGSSPVTAVTVGLVALPALEREGYTDRVRGALVAGGGTLGVLMPSSIPLIIYGVITQTSIGQLFIGTVIPGVLLASLFATYVIFFVKPPIRSQRASWGKRASACVSSAPIVLLPVFIVASIYFGLVTPTETGAVAAIYVMGLGLIERRFTPKRILHAAYSAVLTSSMLLMIFGLGSVFARYSAILQFPQELAAAVSHIPGGPLVVFTGMVLSYLAMGTFLESGAMTILTIPIFFPIATAIGLHPVQFGIMAAINQEIAQIHPPIGLNLVTVSSISGIPLTRMMVSIVPYIVIEIILLYILYFFPALTLFLPSHMLVR